jgi:uncharacterized protein (DUF1015 family)
MDIKPFKAYRFNPAIVGSTGECIAPPYDVLDAAQQKALHERHPYNIIRADLGIKTPQDSETNNVYTRAAEYLNKAIEDGALVEDTKNALYVYIQNFKIAGKSYERTGIIALGKLQRYGSGVQPHEKTLEGPKADRLNLTRATACQLGQIFMLYDDPANVDRTIIAATVKKEPVIDTIDDEGVRHRLFVIDAPEPVKKFTAMMADKETIIADGHHRYETAMNYWAETKNEQAAWQMMTFVNMRNPGLVIQPTHRLLVNMADFNAAALLDMLKDEFKITEFAFKNKTEKQQARTTIFQKMQAAGQEHKTILGFYAAAGAFYTLLLKDTGAMASLCPTMSPAAQTLDVNVLHKLILEKHLGIGDQKLASQSNIVYIKDLGDAIDKSIARVEGGRSQGVFFMNSTRIEQVQQVASAGEKMPQKSTFFYPKIFSGLTVRKVDIQPIQPHFTQSNLIQEECSK